MGTFARAWQMMAEALDALPRARRMATLLESLIPILSMRSARVTSLSHPTALPVIPPPRCTCVCVTSLSRSIAARPWFGAASVRRSGVCLRAHKSKAVCVWIHAAQGCIHMYA